MSALLTVIGIFVFYMYPPVESSTQLLSPQINSFVPQEIHSEMVYPKTIKVVHKIRSGESFRSLFSEYGVEDPSEPIRAAILSDRKDFSFTKGSTLELALNGEGKLAYLRFPSAESDFLLRRVKGGAFETSEIVYEKEDKERIAVGEVRTSFAAAADRAGMSYRVVDEVVDLFAGKFSFHKDFRKGDRFVVIFRDSVREDGMYLGQTEVLAAMIIVKGVPNVAVRYAGDDGVARYFNQDGELIGDAFLRYPLKFSRISSYYSRSRLHPILKRRRPHLGIDFAAPRGTPVRSVADGSILKAGRSGGAGIMLKVKHNEKYATAYLHLSRIAKGVKRGSRVKRGQIIGYVGSTGLSTGPHLDYRFYKNGKSVDPLKVKLPTVETLNAKNKVDERFLKRVLYTLKHYQGVDLEEFYFG
jgi:murein DD-endopeptidase MepM/ murein hydrolase activator NlpD